MPEQRVTEIQAAAVAEITRDFQAQEGELFAKPNVVGVGVGTKVTGGQDTGQPCVKVLVSQKLPESIFLRRDDFVPDQVGGTPTDVEEVGELFASQGGALPGAILEGMSDHQPVDGVRPPVSPLPNHYPLTTAEVGIQVLRERIRPAEGGYSVGHYRITAGTIATAVYDSSPYPGIPARYYILSNNHVLANSNDARIGDPILQPGPYDGGTYPGDVIARLSRFVPIRFDGADNYVDAAIAEGPFHWLDREVYWIGYVRGVRSDWPRIGEILQKTGRTTSYTTGRVTVINAAVNVNFGGGRVARFVRQIVTTNMSAGGDSGSLVLDLNGNAIGLLFAGSSVATIMNHIANVQALLGIRVV